MRLFGKVDGVIDRIDRAGLLTMPFDLGFVFFGGFITTPGLEASVTPSRLHAALAAQQLHAAIPDVRLHAVVQDEDV